MMRLHPLQSLDEHTLALQVVRLGGCLHGTFSTTASPESVEHGSPGIGRVRAIVTCAILTNLEAGRQSLDSEVNKTTLIGCGFDGVGVAFFVDFNGHVLCEEVVLVIIETEVSQRIGTPQVFSRAVVIVNLGVELRCGVDSSVMCQMGLEGCDICNITSGLGSRDVGVDDLGHRSDSLVGHEVEDHGLHIGALLVLPFQIVFGQLCELR
jgi:hypothetical protein